jgi:hypothetical protein
MHSLREREGEAVEDHLQQAPMRGKDSQATRKAAGVAADVPLSSHSDGGHVRSFEAEVSANATIGFPDHEVEAHWYYEGAPGIHAADGAKHQKGWFCEAQDRRQDLD